LNRRTFFVKRERNNHLKIQLYFFKGFTFILKILIYKRQKDSLIVVHISYAVPVPEFTDPDAWLERISFVTGIFQEETNFAEVHAFYHIKYKGTFKRGGIHFHFTGIPKHELYFPYGFNKIVKQLNPDVIILHGLIFPFQMLLLRWQIGKPLKIVCQHHAERPFKDVRIYLQKLADRYIGSYHFASAEQGEEWVKAGVIRDRAKIKEIIGTSSIFTLQRHEKRNGAGNLRFLWVGGLDGNKDPITLVKAFSLFTRSMPDARLFMIFQTDKLLADLQSMLKELDRDNSIILLGRASKEMLQEWYNSVDFIVSTSHYEGSGIAVCEALSCGCIPILTNIPSFRMMTDNGRLGLLFEKGNSDSLLKALAKTPHIKIEEEQQKVYRWFETELSFKANARKILKSIETMKAS
jgi:glycosyltransferase involved in cell wall biosynthesis